MTARTPPRWRRDVARPRAAAHTPREVRCRSGSRSGRLTGRRRTREAPATRRWSGSACSAHSPPRGSSAHLCRALAVCAHATRRCLGYDAAKWERDRQRRSENADAWPCVNDRAATPEPPVLAARCQPADGGCRDDRQTDAANREPGDTQPHGASRRCHDVGLVRNFLFDDQHLVGGRFRRHQINSFTVLARPAYKQRWAAAALQ